MRNKANFRKSQMFITVVSTMNYNEKWTMDTWSKQTQTNPILKGILARGRYAHHKRETESSSSGTTPRYSTEPVSFL
jgi:hypothetical protein